MLCDDVKENVGVVDVDVRVNVKVLNVVCVDVVVLVMEFGVMVECN